jgi:hypothetical protein
MRWWAGLNWTEKRSPFFEDGIESIVCKEKEGIS